MWAKRDITQFVPFSKFKHDPQRLAEETLAEIPRQVVYYMVKLATQVLNENRDKRDSFQTRK